MSDVQRARHVKMESLAEVRREKRNRDVDDDHTGGMRKNDRGGWGRVRGVDSRRIEKAQGAAERVYPTVFYAR